MTTIIFVHTDTDVNYALNYLHTHPAEQVVIFPTDIAALAELHKRNPSLINHLNRLITKNKSIEKQIRTPYRIAKQVPALLQELFRTQLVKILSHSYILQQVYRRHHPNKIVCSYNSFSPLALKHFCSRHRLVLEYIPPQLPSVGEWVTNKLTLICWQIFFLLRHPDVLMQMIFPLTPPTNPGISTRILVFSNGLNLVSYHTVFKSLRKMPGLDCKIITDRQLLPDRFYLAKYHLSTQEISQTIFPSPPSLPKSFHHSNTLIQAAFNEVYLHKKSIINKYIHAQEIISKYQPHLVITTHDPGPSGLSFVLAAKTKKIPSLVLLHGSPSHIHFFHSDKQIIWGPLMKRWLITKAHVPASKLISGSHPIYHDYHRLFLRHPQSPSSVIRIGILTTGDGRYEWHQADYFFFLFSNLQHIKSQFTVTIRTHGMQNLSALGELGHKFGLHIKLNPPQTLEEFVIDCDVIISQNSTAALVGLISNKPIILHDPWFPFLDEGLLKYSSAFIKPKSVNEIPELINKALTNKNFRRQLHEKQRKFLSSYCGKLKEPSDQDLTSAILKLCQ